MKFEKSQQFRLNELIDYSNDSIVSKELIKKTTGTITLFAFDKGQGLSEHTSPYDAFIQIIDGTANIYINKIEHKLNAGEIIIMPATIPHSLEAKNKFKMLLTMIRSAE